MDMATYIMDLGDSSDMCSHSYTMGFIIGSIVFRRVEDQIKITSALDGQILDEKEKQPMNTGLSYPVRGTLKNLPTKHRVWLLCV